VGRQRAGGAQRNNFVTAVHLTFVSRKQQGSLAVSQLRRSVGRQLFTAALDGSTGLQLHKFSNLMKQMRQEVLPDFQ
jgi:hypothetical protein